HHDLRSRYAALILAVGPAHRQPDLADALLQRLDECLRLRLQHATEGTGEQPCHASRAGRSGGRWPWRPEQGSGERRGRAGDAAALRGAALALGGPAHQIQQLSRIELDVGLEDLRSPGVTAGSLAGEVAVLLVVEIGEAVLLQVVLDVQHLAAQ